MSITHTVVFTLVHPSGSPDEQHFLDKAARDLASIPGVLEFTISRQVSSKSAMAWQFAMRFQDQRDYDAYNAHPVHAAFVSRTWAIEVSEFQEYDFVVR